ncbi:hypothetical protein EXE53_30540, partial [Halorubrum sp. SD626R]|uniref:carbamoyltransferase N-terminal domain-containing protein n=1 Tax=Halorubrum sp. SD626R TaxID=1419722 RepID=UPI001135673F
MSRYILGCNPCVSDLGAHDPSAALFADGEILYAVEEERFTRKKGALFTFPVNSIRHCLEYGDIDVQDLDRIVVPWDPRLLQNLFHYNLKRAVEYDTLDNTLEKAKFVFKRGILDRSGFALDIVEKQFKQQL